LVTALALEHLARQQTATNFGSLRLWGSIGFAISTFGIGAFFVDAQAIWWVLPLYASGNLVLALIAYTFPDADIHGQASWREGLVLLRQKRQLAWVLLGLLLIWFFSTGVSLLGLAILIYAVYWRPRKG